MTLETAKTLAEIGQGAAAVVAVLGAGTWAVFHYWRTGDARTRAEVQHQVVFKKLNEGKLLIRASVTMRNTGNIMLRWKNASVRLQRVLLCAAEDVTWLENRLNANGRAQSEADWSVVRESPVAGCVQEIEPGESGVGWNHTTLHDVSFTEEVNHVAA